MVELVGDTAFFACAEQEVVGALLAVELVAALAAGLHIDYPFVAVNVAFALVVEVVAVE